MRMSPCEALCGQWCRTPICWEEVGDKMIMGSKRQNEGNIKQTEDYAKIKRKYLEFNVEDKVFLKIAP